MTTASTLTAPTHRKDPLVKHRTRGAVFAGIAAATALMGTSTAWAAGTDAGLALIVNPANQTVNINSGGSQTVWTLKLPTGAACSADTAGNQYLIQSYLVDAAANPDPGLLTFNSEGPIGTGTVFPLFDATGSPYISQATENTTGAIRNIPGFDLNIFSIDARTTPRNPEGTLTLPAGTYNLGIACSKPGPGGISAGDKFWNTKIVVSANGTDVNGETWQTQPFPQVPEIPLSILLPLSAAAVLGTGVLVSKRKRSNRGALATA